MHLRRLRKVTAAKMVRNYLRSVFPSLSIRADEALGEEARSPRATNSFLVSGVIRGRQRHLRLRVLHPARDIPGSVLDFDPAKIRAWYEDGLRTARCVRLTDPGPANGPGHTTDRDITSLPEPRTLNLNLER